MIMIKPCFIWWTSTAPLQARLEPKDGTTLVTTAKLRLDHMACGMKKRATVQDNATPRPPNKLTRVPTIARTSACLLGCSSLSVISATVAEMTDDGEENR